MRLLNRFKPPIPAYWFARTENFGDLIGPWLIGLISGRRTFNVAGLNNKAQTGLMTVGSVIQMMDRPGMDIWGSGLIRAANAKTRERLQHNKPNKIFAVRGPKTRYELVRKLGWEVPEIYGDPALLLPRFYRPKPSRMTAGKTAVIPHYVHKKFFLEEALDGMALIGVEQHPSAVIDQIASADRVISTSLHGIICAHAYGVPWVWLSIEEKSLSGGAFKFDDFFAGLDHSRITASTSNGSEINNKFLRSLATTASRPADTRTYEPLIDSFPLR